MLHIIFTYCNLKTGLQNIPRQFVLTNVPIIYGGDFFIKPFFKISVALDVKVSTGERSVKGELSQ